MILDVDLRMLRQDAGRETHRCVYRAIFDDLVSDEKASSTSAARAGLIARGIVPAILDAATRRDYNQDEDFVCCTIDLLNLLCGDLTSPGTADRSAAAAVVDQGGASFLARVLSQAAAGESDGGTRSVLGCLGIVGSLISTLGAGDTETALKISRTVMGCAVKAIERFGLFDGDDEDKSAEVFIVGCWVIGLGCLPGYRPGTELFRDMVGCLANGLSCHRHDDNAQKAGRHILRCIVGPEGCVYVTDRVEMCCIRDAEHSPAA